jgi:DNA-binding CsgD family transcriptional regulator
MKEQTARILADAAYAIGHAHGVAPLGDVFDLAAHVTLHDATALILWDPDLRTHRSLLSAGYSPEVLEGLGDRYAATAEHRRMRVTRSPLRIDDLPYDYRQTDIFHEVIEPSGFSDGMTVCLFQSDHSYSGMLHFSASSPGSFDEEAVELISALSPLVARLCSGVLDRPAALNASSTPRVSLIDGAGGILPVASAEPAHCIRQLSFLDLVRRFRLANISTARGLWPAGEGWIAVEMQKMPDSTGSPAMIRVEERELDNPFGLSLRELDILQGVARGDSNQQIAHARGISLRTVTTHVERLLAKTGQQSRAGLVALAGRRGLLTLAL